MFHAPRIECGKGKVLCMIIKPIFYLSCELTNPELTFGVNEE